MQIGSHVLSSNVVLAPMAGVTDGPFRRLCRRLGAGLAASEMVAANPALRTTRKTRQRLDHRGENSPRVVQIAGAEPQMMADCARYNVDRGAQIIDINMGCPAKKVCNRMAGSALLGDEALVARILAAVVAAVTVPVTLKIRTGPRPENRNGVSIARIAEDAGIQALAVHGRTRACAFGGRAEYDTITAIKTAVQIPVFANGDIDTPERARGVLEQTGADGLMIGRAAQGNPWIFRELGHFLATGRRLPPPGLEEVSAVMEDHLCGLYDFYGETQGLRVARKHVGWYVRRLPGGEILRRRINQVDRCQGQLETIRCYFEALRSETLAA